MTIDYDITVTACLCVLVPRKTFTCNNNKQTTTLFHCTVRIKSMTMENDECVTCILKFCHFASSKDKC